MPKPIKYLMLGFVGGVLATASVFLLLRKQPPPPESIPAAVVGVPNGASLETSIFQKEAQAQGISLKDLYLKELWGKVQVTYQDAQENYNRSAAQYGRPYEEIKAQIFRGLRKREYERLKRDYLAALSEKYKTSPSLSLPLQDEGGGLGWGKVEGADLLSPVVLESGEKAETAEAYVSPGSSEGPHPSRGPAKASITITEFADFHCGYCHKAAPVMKKILENYPDKVRLVFRHYPLSPAPGAGSFLTHEASACAQEQGKFWEFHDGIFSLPQAPTPEDLDKIANQINLNEAQYHGCLRSGRYQGFLKNELEEGKQKGISGTPAFFVNQEVVSGALPYEHFVQVMEGIWDPSKKKQVLPAQPAVPPPVPSQIVKFNDLDGKPALGPKKAPVTLVEFSDFHCPFCSRVVPALKKIMENYSGKVRLIWRHYPLAIHPGSERTHEASECASEQEKFWPYHDKLFETQSQPRDDTALAEIAKELGLNVKKFKKCLEKGKYRGRIQQEIKKANEYGVRGTPAVFVNGRLVSGAQPYETFEKMVKEELAKT